MIQTTKILSSAVAIGFVFFVSQPGVASEADSSNSTFTVSPSEQEFLPSAATIGKPDAPLRFIYFGDYAFSREETIFYDFLLPRLVDEYVASGIARITVAPVFVNGPYARFLACVPDQQRFGYVAALNADREILTPFVGTTRDFTTELAKSRAARGIEVSEECLEQAGEDDPLPVVNSFMTANRVTSSGILLLATSEESSTAVSAARIRATGDQQSRREIAETAWTAIAGEVNRLLARASSD